jgi:EAL domain-containing protein (putative c-di-GMP-specific phosphodiesterase class I)
MQAAASARSALEGDIRLALQRNEFLLHYQPVVNEQAEVMGAEALVRWMHPQRGMVSPGEFIPLAEQTGLILPLGRLVLRLACEQLALWAASPAPLAGACR